MTENKDVMDALFNVIDPELNMNIVDLGLVYRAEVVEGNIAEVDFTLTYPGCPLGDMIVSDIESTLRSRTDAADVRVQVVWNPPWDQSRMSENARLMLGYPI